MSSSEDSTIKIGTPLKSSAIKVMLLGAGELGKEVADRVNAMAWK